MYTGYTTPGPVRAPAGGVRVTAEPATETGTWVICAPAPGPPASEMAGSPEPAASVSPEPGSVTVGVPAGSGAESHMRGALAVNAGAAVALAWNERLPAASALNASPGDD